MKPVHSAGEPEHSLIASGLGSNPEPSVLDDRLVGLKCL